MESRNSRWFVPSTSGQTHLCMEALNRRAKRHRFRTFYSVVFIEGWRLWFGNDTVSMASLAVHKCHSSNMLKTSTEHCGAQ
ncbi:hypothetical protein NC651_006657 [Populus alba x Populus x berolinensis]|nr:hypothetical protein NC651_006657 [Populus alba x Populus x berolinensis]